MEFLQNLNLQITSAINDILRERKERQENLRLVWKDGVSLEKKRSETNMLLKIKGVCVGKKPRPDGRWQGYIIDKGERRCFFAPSQPELIQKIEYCVKHGLPKKEKKEKSGIPNTFSAFFVYFWETFRKKKLAKDTYRSDFSRFNTHLKPYFGNKIIKKITPADCQNLLNRLDNAGKGKTCDEIYSLLSITFKGAIAHGLMDIIPLAIVYHTKHENEHGSALTREEETAFLEAIKGTKNEKIYALALFTGLRPNELKTAKIDGDFVVAVNSKRKTKKVEYKKIPIIDKLRPYLPLPTVDGSESFLDALRSELKTYLSGHILYDLRTTFYSRCKECGVSEYAISKFMGHSLGALGNAYTDLSDEFLLKEGRKIVY